MNHRLLLAEDNFLIREGVRGMLSSTGTVEVVASCGNLDEAVEAIDRLVPDVVLTDIRMPPHRRDEGIVIATHCRRQHPSMGVVLLSQYVEASYVRTLLTEGTHGRGYLLKERVADLDDLLAAIDEVAGGGSAIDPVGPWPAAARLPGSHHASVRCWRALRKATPMPPSPANCSSPSTQWRSTSTRSSPNSD